MGKWLDNYTDGIMALFVGHAISYYAYLSIVLSEIFYLWRFFPENAMAFTILLGVNCIVIAVFGLLKRLCVFTRGERIVAKVYWVALGIIFVIGCFINIMQNMLLYLLPMAFAGKWIFLRDIQTMRFATSDSKILTTITRFFANCLMWPILTAFVSLTPIVILTYVLNMTLTSRIFVFLIPMLFAMLLPFITWFEEDFVNEDIFEIGYEIVFTKRVEGLLKAINVSVDVVWSDEFAEAVYKLEASEGTDDDFEEFAKELKRIQDVLTNSKKCN